MRGEGGGWRSDNDGDSEHSRTIWVKTLKIIRQWSIYFKLKQSFK